MTEPHEMTDPPRTHPADVESSLHERVARAREAVDRFQQEYDGVLTDGDTIQEDQDAVRQLLQAAHGELAAAERAVERFESGEYGRCVNCSEMIGVERLDALPGVETCQACST